jgi:hypothetical protein
MVSNGLAEQVREISCLAKLAASCFDTMLILLPFLLLITSMLVILVISRFRQQYGYYWITGAGGALFAWIGVFAIRSKLGESLHLFIWRPQTFFTFSPTLLVDAVSWSFALALASLTLSVMLTDVGRLKETDWVSWAWCLLMGAVGILAVLAGNLLTLVLAWTFIDFMELLLLLPKMGSRKMRQNAMVYFSTSLLGTMLVVWAQISALADGEVLIFGQIPPEYSLYLLGAVGLRLGVLPLNVSFLREPSLRRGLGTILRLVPASASLVLLVRIAGAGVLREWYPYLQGLILLAALYGGVAWLRSSDELTGRPYWIFTTASLAMAAGLKALPETSLAWSQAALYSGGVLFLASARHKRLAPIAVLGLFGISVLPLSPTWVGADLFSPPIDLLSLGYLFVLSLLLVGYVRHVFRDVSSTSGVERWVWVVYPLGLALLPVTHLVSNLWFGVELTAGTETTPWWPGFVSILFSVGLFMLVRKGWNIPLRVFAALDSFFSLNWLYRLLGFVFRGLGWFMSIPATLLEGDGGILWTLLFVVVLLSILAQIRIGG